MVVGHLGAAPQMASHAHLEVRALVGHGVAGVEAHQAALAVQAVERGLRTAKHVHTQKVVEVVVEGRLAHQRHAIHIDAHGGRTDARAYAANIHRRGVARTVDGHREVGNESRQLAQVAGAQGLHLPPREHRGANGLLAHAVLLLGLAHHNHLIEIAHQGCVGGVRNVCLRRSRGGQGQGQRSHGAMPQGEG